MIQTFQWTVPPHTSILTIYNIINEIYKDLQRTNVKVFQGTGYLLQLYWHLTNALPLDFLLTDPFFSSM